MNHHPAEAPVAVTNEMVLSAAEAFLMHPACADTTVGHGPIRAALEAANLYLRPDPEVTALRAEVERLKSAEDGWKQLVENWEAWAKAVQDDIVSNAAIAKIAQERVARVRALADEWYAQANEPAGEPYTAADNAREQCSVELRAALEGPK